MAFLQIKKDYHLDKPLIVRLDQEPIDVRGEKNRFDNLEFKSSEQKHELSALYEEKIKNMEHLMAIKNLLL